VRLPPPLPTERAPTVRIVAPSGPLGAHRERLHQGIKTLKNAGFAVNMGKCVTSRNERGYLAGGDSVRQEEFVRAVGDPASDIVWWARGGSGAGRIEPAILNEIAHLNPKWLIGFSDASSLLNSISIKLGWVTLHGPTVTLLPSQPDCLTALVNLTSDLGDPSFQGRFGTLPIYGGNITVLASMMGCLDLSHLPPHQLLLEDVGEAPYRLDRSLTQLRNAWPIHLTKKVLLGDLDLAPETTRRIASYIAEDFGCPVREGVEAGHRGHVSFIPLGHTRVVPCA
jgi:muramoyltetrapeptide carboxypeptidase